MVLRLDFGCLDSKKQILPDGRVICPATYARDGVLIYRQPDGSVVRELRLPETNKAPETLTSYAVSPLTLDHPSVLVDKNNAKNLAVGFSDRQVFYDRGFLRGVVMIHDSEAIDRVGRGKVQLSPGYYCDVEESSGVWRGQPYDRIQRNVRTNHIAIVDIGRNGPEIRLHWDSADAECMVQQTSEPERRLYFDLFRADSGAISKPKGGRMSTRSLTLDSITWEDIPADLAEKISDIRSDAEEMESRIEELQERSDAQMAILRSANQTLAQLGYVIDDVGTYVRVDDGSAEASDAPEDAYGEEQEDAYREAQVGKGGEVNMDSLDTLETRLDAWVAADILCPGIREVHFDADMDLWEIQRLTIDSVIPAGIEYDDFEVPGLYRAVIEGLVKGDSESYAPHADALEGAVRQANAAAQSRNDSSAAFSSVDESYLEPLAFSISR